MAQRAGVVARVAIRQQTYFREERSAPLAARKGQVNSAGGRYRPLGTGHFRIGASGAGEVVNHGAGAPCPVSQKLPRLGRPMVQRGGDCTVAANRFTQLGRHDGTGSARQRQGFTGQGLLERAVQ